MNGQQLVTNNAGNMFNQNTMNQASQSPFQNMQQPQNQQQQNVNLFQQNNQQIPQQSTSLFSQQVTPNERQSLFNNNGQQQGGNLQQQQPQQIGMINQQGTQQQQSSGKYQKQLVQFLGLFQPKQQEGLFQNQLQKNPSTQQQNGLFQQNQPSSQSNQPTQQPSLFQQNNQSQIFSQNQLGQQPNQQQSINSNQQTFPFQQLLSNSSTQQQTQQSLFSQQPQQQQPNTQPPSGPLIQEQKAQSLTQIQQPQTQPQQQEKQQTQTGLSFNLSQPSTINNPPQNQQKVGGLFDNANGSTSLFAQQTVNKPEQSSIQGDIFKKKSEPQPQKTINPSETQSLFSTNVIKQPEQKDLNLHTQTGENTNKKKKSEDKSSTLFDNFKQQKTTQENPSKDKQPEEQKSLFSNLQSSTVLPSQESKKTESKTLFNIPETQELESSKKLPNLAPQKLLDLDLKKSEVQNVSVTQNNYEQTQIQKIESDCLESNVNLQSFLLSNQTNEKDIIHVVENEEIFQRLSTGLQSFQPNSQKDQKFWKEFEEGKHQFQGKKSTEIQKLLINEISKTLEVSSVIL